MAVIAITYGTFDMFHIGHLRLFERIRSQSERLIVAVSTDEFNALKGKKALIGYEERRDIIAALRCVDLVIPESSWEQKIGDIQAHRVDAFFMGDDWAGKFDFLRPYCQVVYLPRTVDISTTSLKESIRSPGGLPNA